MRYRVFRMSVLVEADGPEPDVISWLQDLDVSEWTGGSQQSRLTVLDVERARLIVTGAA